MGYMLVERATGCDVELVERDLQQLDDFMPSRCAYLLHMSLTAQINT